MILVLGMNGCNICLLTLMCVYCRLISVFFCGVFIFLLFRLLKAREVIKSICFLYII